MSHFFVGILWAFYCTIWPLTALADTQEQSIANALEAIEPFACPQTCEEYTLLQEILVSNLTNILIEASAIKGAHSSFYGKSALFIAIYSSYLTAFQQFSNEDAAKALDISWQIARKISFGQNENTARLNFYNVWQESFVKNNHLPITNEIKKQFHQNYKISGKISVDQLQLGNLYLWQTLSLPFFVDFFMKAYETALSGLKEVSTQKNLGETILAMLNTKLQEEGQQLNPYLQLMTKVIGYKPLRLKNARRVCN